MPFRQLFFIEGRLLGESPRDAFFLHGELVPPLSGIWYCQHCGEVYAKAPVVKANGTSTAWQSFRGVCRKCAPRSPYEFEVPGSIWLSWDKEFLARLPPAVLTWELLRHIDKAESLPPCGP